MGMKPVRVGQLNSYIGRVLKTDPILGSISVIGEISNLKFHGSGHVYFSMKDADSRINCFLSSSNLRNISCPLDEGMEIVAHGFISVYERGGYYSLNVRDIEVNGSGQLAVKFEKLKENLEKEGLFSAEHKKQLPFFPLKLAVVTSETGAAVRDIIRTVKNKNRCTDIYVYPVLVQGPAAAEDIANTIREINRSHSDIDVIITGRGGGSMEELWAFNEEIVARSIFESEIPVISAVGHETDFTIADFAADLRAATPTAAAEAAVPDTEELRRMIDSTAASMGESLKYNVEIWKRKLESLNPRTTSELQLRISAAAERIRLLKEFIESSNPKAILSRGYSIVTDESGGIICGTGMLVPGQKVIIETGSGTAQAEITDINRGEMEND